MRLLTVFFLLGFIFLPGLSRAGELLKLPPLPPPEVYGDVLMNRSARENNVTPVYFSHWIHRVKYTCRVCHFELEFSMKSNDTPLVCNRGNMRGKYCAACHNGKVSFGPAGEDGETCNRCHNADRGPNDEKFYALQKVLPKGRFGNEINWAKALDEGLIKPENSLSGGSKETISINKTLTLTAEMFGIPSAVFPHKTHEQWLDCSNCHPELFNIKKKTTRNMTMNNMLKGESCAVCHLRVAFPLDDCKKCHPTMRMR